MDGSTKTLLECVVAIHLLGSGCTHNQLRRNTVNQMATVHEMQLQQVLDNLAMFADNRDSYPYYSIVTQGNSTLTDTGSLAITNGFSRTGGNFLFSSLGINPTASRAAAEAWSISPINDSVKLTVMRCVYRRAIAGCFGESIDGCPNCENLFKTFYGNLPASSNNLAADSATTNGSTIIQAYRGAPPLEVLAPVQPPEQIPRGTKSTEEQKPREDRTKSPAGMPAGSGDAPKPAQWKHVQGIVTPDCIDFRKCWFCYGKSLPKLQRKKCCMVGHYCGTYVWVPDEGRDELTKLTLLIQDIAYYDPPSPANPNGNQPTQFPQTAISTMQLFRAYAPSPGVSISP